MAKVLSIELGQSIIRICEIDYKVSTPRVHKCLEVMTPEGSVEDGFVLDAKEVSKEIVKALKDAGIKTKKVVYTIASGRIASREATVPYVKQNKLPEIVDATAGDYFPVDLSEFKITYQILDTPQDASGTKHYRLSLLIAPNELLESYYELSKACGFDVVALDYVTNSLATVLKGVFKSGVKMAININEGNSQLFVFSEGNTVLSRTIPVGVGDVVETVRELEEEETGEEVSYKAALKKIRTAACIKTDNYDKSEEQAVNDAPSVQYRLEVTDSLGNIGSSILRVMDYYNSRNVDSTIEKVYLTGFAEDFVGLRGYLSEELGITVEALSSIDNICDFGLETDRGSYTACAGAAIDPMDLIPDQHSDKKKKKIKKDPGQSSTGPNYILRGVLVLVVCLLLAGALAVAALVPYAKEKSTNDSLKKQEADLEPIVAIYRDSVKARIVCDDVKRMYASTEVRNDNLTAFLDELEKKLPTTVNVLSFAADQQTVNMNMNVDSKEAVAKIIDEFRTFDSLTDIRVTSVNEEIDEMGLSAVVNFTLECNYAPIVHEKETKTEAVEEEE